MRWLALDWGTNPPLCAVPDGVREGRTVLAGTDDREAYPHTLHAVSATARSFALCCSMVRGLLTIDVPNPH